MKANHMDQAFNYGTQGLALISAIWNAPDVQQAVKEFLQME
jgi:thiamine monophosphate synthase